MRLCTVLFLALSLVVADTQQSQCDELGDGSPGSCDDDVSLLQSAKEPLHLARSAPVDLPPPARASQGAAPVPAVHEARIAGLNNRVAHESHASGGSQKKESALPFIALDQKRSSIQSSILSEGALLQKAAGKHRTKLFSFSSLLSSVKQRSWTTAAILIGGLLVLMILVFGVWSGPTTADRGGPAPRAAAANVLMAHWRFQQVARGGQPPAIESMQNQGETVQTDAHSHAASSASALSYHQTPSFSKHPKASSASSIFAPPVPPKTFEAATPSRGGAPETKYWLPSADLSELSSYLETGWFNIRGMNGEPSFHVEITIQQAGRVLEVSKVHTLGHSEILATVRPAVSASRPSVSSGLPPQVLEVCLQDNRPHAQIESWGCSGGYSITKAGQKAYSVVGDTATSQLSVVSVSTGQQAGKIERMGVNFEGTDYLELLLRPSVIEERVFLLASVLAIITLRSWPTQAETPTQGSEASYPRMMSVLPAASATSLAPSAFSPAR